MERSSREKLVPFEYMCGEMFTNWNLLLNYSMNYEYKTEIFSCASAAIVIICVLSSFSIFAICTYLCYSFYCEFHMLRAIVLKLKTF